MYKFPEDHIIIIPHTQEYMEGYGVTMSEVVQTLNEPDVHEGLSDDRYTVEKTIGKRRIYIYYYHIVPTTYGEKVDEQPFAIVDFVSATNE